MDEQYLYRVYDTETDTYWSNSKGKTVWNEPGHAKNAWNVRVGWREPKFSEQTRFVIHRFKMVLAE